jgi:hypothetical protein
MELKLPIVIGTIPFYRINPAILLEMMNLEIPANVQNDPSAIPPYF